MIPAAERIEALRERNPDAVELATAISLAVRADPELLRHARLAVGADATAEADLWWSDLVAAQNADGIMLEPAAAEALRARLAERPELLDASWSLISAQHASEHTAVRLEELVNWLSVAGGDEAADRIEELLIAGAREWMTTAAEPAGGVRWIASALRRLPRAAAASPAGAALGAAAATHLGRTPELDRLPADAYDNWFPWLLSRLKTASLRVALIDGGVEFEGETGETFDAPDTDPVLLTLAWGTSTRDVTVRRGERTTVALDADAVELTTIAGRRFTLRRRGAQTAGLDFSAVRAAHRPAVGIEPLIERIAVEAARLGGWIAINGPAETGKTTALCGSLDRLEAEGTIVLQHFYGRGPAWWDERETVLGSLVAQLRAAVPVLPVDTANLRGSPSNVGGPGRELDQLLTFAGERPDGPPIVVALDDPPVAGFDELKSWLFSSAFPSLTPPRSSFVLASRYASAVRDFLEDGDPYRRVDVTDTDLSGAYLRARWPELMRAFRGTVTLADSTTISLLQDEVEALGYTIGDGVGVAVVTVGARPPSEFVRLQRSRGHPLVVVGYEVTLDHARSVLGEVSPEEFIAGPELLGERLMALTWPGVEPLLTHPIARLRRIIDWIVTQPPGSIHVLELPASLTASIPFAEFNAIEQRMLGLIAVGFPDLTLGDILWATPAEEWSSVMDALGRLQRLHLIDEQPFPTASDPGRHVELAGARSLAPRDPHLANALFEPALLAAHRWFASAQRARVGLAPPYFARHELAHALASEDPELTRSALDVTALTRRARQLGLAAVAAELGDSPMAEAVRALAARSVDPADFPAQLYYEVERRSGTGEAAHHLHPNEALRPRLTAWPDAFDAAGERVEEVAELLPFGVALTSGEIEPFEGAAFLAPGSWFVGLRQQLVAAIGPDGITVTSAEGHFSLDTPGEVTWAAAAADGLVAMTANGALLHWPQLIQKPRRLLGHAGPITAAAMDERGPFVEVSSGGERVGYGVFVGEGLVLPDGFARSRKPDAIGYGGRLHRAVQESTGRLRVDLAGHPVTPVATPQPLSAGQRIGRHTIVSISGDLVTLRADTEEPALGQRAVRDRFVFHDGTIVATWLKDDVALLVLPDLSAAAEPGTLTGQWFATASEDGTVAVWGDDDAPVTLYRGHRAPVRAVAIRGRRVISGGDDGTVRMWSAEHGHDLAVLGVGSAVTALAIRFDLKVAWGAADGSLGLWDPDDPSGSERIAGHGGRVLGIDPDGVDLISWATDGSVRLWTDDSIVFRGPAPARRALAREDGVRVLWGDETVTTEHPAELEGLSALALNASGDRVAYGIGTDLAVATRGRGIERNPQEQPLVACAFVGDAPVVSIDGPIAGRFQDFAVGRSDGSVSLTPGAYSVADAPSSAVLSLDSEETGQIMSGHADGTIRLWRGVDGQLQRSLLLQQAQPATHVAFCGVVGASADGNAVRLWDLDDGMTDVLATLPQAEITGLASPAADLLACVTRAGQLWLWAFGERELLAQFSAPAGFVALAAAGGTVAARGSTGRLYVWDVGSGTEVLHDYSSGPQLHFARDVEVLAIDAKRVAVDQPPGFWDELDEAGRFIVPPLIAAGRTVEIRADRSDIDLTIRVARDGSPDGGASRRPESAPRPRRKR